MKTSEQIDKLFPALVAAQAASKTAKKDAQNPHFRSHYADLSSVWEAVSDALAKNKLAVMQAPGCVIEGQLYITTRIIHESGQWLESDASTPLPKLDPQGYGSAVTYMRRYTLAALLGVVAGEDDDGNAASEPKAEPLPASQTWPAPKSAPKQAAQVDGAPVTIAGRVVKVEEKQGPKATYYVITLDSCRDWIKCFGKSAKAAAALTEGDNVTIDGKWNEYQGRFSINADTITHAVTERPDHGNLDVNQDDIPF